MEAPMLQFTHPGALILLIVIPLFFWISRSAWHGPGPTLQQGAAPDSLLGPGVAV